MTVLAISGSLRAASINSALLRAAVRLAPPDVQIGLLSGAGELPLFNPDLEVSLPPAVVALHARIVAADALLIASPEYAVDVLCALCLAVARQQPERSPAFPLA